MRRLIKSIIVSQKLNNNPEIRSLVGESCWLAMKTYTGPKLSFSEKRSAFNLTWTLTLGEIWKYRDFRYLFAASPKDSRYKIRWISEAETGSGVLITSRGHILTAGHVVEAAVDEGSDGYNVYPDQATQKVSSVNILTPS
jgi:S1-C subfamily serine protease